MNLQIIKIGVISALREEQAGLIEQMQDAVTTQRGMRHYVTVAYGELKVFAFYRVSAK